MGSCDFCGQGIADCYQIRSSDGRNFIVGSSCVNKTGDRGLRRGVNKHKVEIRHQRDDARIAAALELFESPGVEQILRATRRGNGDLYSWASWMFRHAGRTGKVKVARAIQAAAKGE